MPKNLRREVAVSKQDSLNLSSKVEFGSTAESGYYPASVSPHFLNGFDENSERSRVET